MSVSFLFVCRNNNKKAKVNSKLKIKNSTKRLTNACSISFNKTSALENHVENLFGLIFQQRSSDINQM